MAGSEDSLKNSTVSVGKEELVVHEPQLQTETVDDLYEVDVVNVESCEVKNDDGAAAHATMSFNLQSSGLAVQIQTTTPVNLQMIDLQSKLELFVFKLTDTEQRLDAAMRRIGFLEAQLVYKGDEIEKLTEKLLILQAQ